MFPIDEALPPESGSSAGFLIRGIAASPDGIPPEPRSAAELVALAAKQFGISRQAVNKQLRGLVEQGVLLATGSTKARRYAVPYTKDQRVFPREGGPSESTVWADYIAPKLRGLTTAFAVAQFAFTEIYNNALEHSDALSIGVGLIRSPTSVRFSIHDDGVGIFCRLKEMYRYVDEQAAVLDLVQGRITTSPESHTGWGIFYSSRMCDRFSIMSGRTFFTHTPQIDADSDWLMEMTQPTSGTHVVMSVDTRTPLTPSEIFQRYAMPGKAGLNVTHVPMALAQVGQERLISRSQAKVIAARFDWFQGVVLDFKGVSEIGQGFADELFRVWQREHPAIGLRTVNANESIMKLIYSARATLEAETKGSGLPIHPNLQVPQR
jgi:hypothetical protein